MSNDFLIELKFEGRRFAKSVQQLFFADLYKDNIKLSSRRDDADFLRATVTKKMVVE